MMKRILKLLGSTMLSFQVSAITMKCYANSHYFSNDNAIR